MTRPKAEPQSEAVRDGRGGYLCPVCGHGPFRTPKSARNDCPNRAGRNHGRRP